MTDEEIAKLKTDLTEARAQAASATRERDNLKVVADSLPTLQAQIAAHAATIERLGADNAAHMAMVDLGITDASVRDYTLHQHARHRSEAGDKAQDFAAFLAAQKAAPSAVLAPFLAPKAPSAPGTPAPPAPPRTETGALPAPGAPAPYAPGSIANLPADKRIRGTDAAKGLTVASLGG